MHHRLNKHWRSCLILAIAAGGMSPLAGAQETPVPAPPSAVVPTTAPAEQRSEGRGRREGRETWGDRDGRPSRRERHEGNADDAPPAPVSDAEWAQVMESVQKVSPNRWKMLAKMLQEPERPFHAKVRAGVAKRHRELIQLEKSDPERHALEVRRDGIEDAIFGLLDAYRASKSDELKSQIRERVAKLFDTRLELRKLRLARVESELAALRMERAGEALKAEAAASLDPAGREASIDRMLEGFLRHARPGGPRRPRGEGRGQPPPGEVPPPPAGANPDE